MLRTIKRAPDVQMLVPHRVSAESRYVLRQPAVNQRARRRSRRRVGRRERKAPRRRAVPKILDCRIVVQRYSKRKRLPEQFVILIGVAQIRVVPAEMIVLRRVCHLRKTSDVTSPSSRQKQRNVLRKLDVSVLRTRLRRPRTRK